MHLITNVQIIYEEELIIKILPILSAVEYLGQF